MCGKCTNKNCFFFCERFKFVFDEFIKTNVHIWKFPNILWGIYLNLNEYRFKIEHVLSN